MSARRATPMPRGSRPAMAAFTIGRQEGKRDRHVDLANAAPLALGNAFRICVRVGKKFVEPTAASRNRCDQERAGLRAYRTSVLRRLPNTLNVAFPNRVGADILARLDGVAASTGS